MTLLPLGLNLYLKVPWNNFLVHLAFLFIVKLCFTLCPELGFGPWEMNPEQIHILSQTTASLAADQNPVFSESPRWVSVSEKKYLQGLIYTHTHTQLCQSSLISHPICDRLDYFISSYFFGAVFIVKGQFSNFYFGASAYIWSYLLLLVYSLCLFPSFFQSHIR